VQTFNLQHSWADLLAEANAFRVDGRSADTIAITRTPKTVGNARQQALWYTSEAVAQESSTKMITHNAGDWNGLANKVRTYLNEYVPPHQLISVSLHEDGHPNKTGGINAVITHNAGDHPARLETTSAAR